MKVLPVNFFQNNLIITKQTANILNNLERSPKTDMISFCKKKQEETCTKVPVYKAGEVAYDISYSKASFLKGNYEMISEDVELYVSNGTMNGKRTIKGEAFDKEVNLVLDSAVLNSTSGKITGKFGKKDLDIKYKQENDRDVLLIGDLNGMDDIDIRVLAILAIDKIKRDLQNENDLAMAIVSS